MNNKSSARNILCVAMLATLLCGCGPTGADVWAQEQKERKAKQEAAAAKEAEAAKAAAEEELRRQRIDRSLLKKLKVTKDAMRGLTFYSAGSLDSNGKYMKLYIAEDSDGMLLRLKILQGLPTWSSAAGVVFLEDGFLAVDVNRVA